MFTMNNEKQLNERQEKLLKLLVECYIREGQPIGSKILAEKSDFSLSSATIRNIMADLEAYGFLDSPHTSAGRIPTVRGYRFFVDSLLNARSIDANAVQDISDELKNYTNTNELVSAASSILSSVTKLAGVVMLPRHELALLRHVEFLPLSEKSVLVILVLNHQEVQNRIIYTDRTYTANELQQVGNFLTQNFIGKDLGEIRHNLLATLRKERRDIEQLINAIMDMTNKALFAMEHNDYVVAGEANLLEMTEHSRLDKLKDLFNAFTEKRDILHILDQCLHADGIKIYIGEESGYELFEDYSLVTMPYRDSKQIIGVLGVIGPRRMAYDRAIAAVDVTARVLGAALEEVN
jgi:heat-inducible transcriptional repressor